MKNTSSISLTGKKTSYKYIKSNASFVVVTILSVLILSFETVAEPILSEPCVSTHFDEEASIKSIIDGDTVILTDDRHIRLIGINTPEINHDDIKLSDTGALKAKASLEELLKSQKSVHLSYGEERFDRHKRTLAHLYLKNGLNIQAELLRQGLAMPLRIAPNLSLADCYNTASLSAKQKKRGLWALPQYQTRHVNNLIGSEKGFHIISGKVERITESRSSIWLNLQNNVALRIHKDDLNYFNKNDLISLQGKTVEANGWLYKRNKQLRMRIRHKLDLRIITY
jgi:micrococcal nuclease